MTNRRHTVLYTGVTSNLARRVYAEHFPDIHQTIAAEKTIKAGSLIEKDNPEWLELEVW